MRLTISLSLVSALVLGLSACGGTPEGGEVAAAEKTPKTTVELSPIQRAAFERFNREETQANYARLRDELAQAAEKGESGKPAPDAIDFAWADRDGDDKLAIAEFALWKLPVDGNAPMQAGDAKSYLSDDELNEIAGHFFSFDTDGDSMLSEAEFATASGAGVPDEKAEAEG